MYGTGLANSLADMKIDLFGRREDLLMVDIHGQQLTVLLNLWATTLSPGPAKTMEKHKIFHYDLLQ